MSPVDPPLGWNDRLEAEFKSVANNKGTRGRVVRIDTTSCTVADALGVDHVCHIGKRLRRATTRPVVGDWVIWEPGSSGVPPTVRNVLERHSAFCRLAAGKATRAQVIATNIDVVFIVSSLDGDLSERRLERYLVAASQAPCRAVILLTKAGLSDDVERGVARAREAAQDIPVHAIDVLEGLGVDVLDEYFASPITAAFVGSSGVGKSTLVNHLVGEARVATAPVRASDNRGQHTTSHRELITLDGGASIIDTPGIRELGLWADEDAIEDVFDDIVELAQQCRFADCQHGGEPGCAVLAAVSSGELLKDRLEGYANLRVEQARTAARSRQGQRNAERQGARFMRETQRRRRGAKGD